MTTTQSRRCQKCKWVHEADSTAGTSFMGVELCPLHAAAHDLLDAAVSMVDDFGDTNPEELDGAAFTKLRGAIDSARSGVVEPPAKACTVIVERPYGPPHCWLWPDRNIGKRESRRLREEHNALVNKHHAALDALNAALPALIHLGNFMGNEFAGAVGLEAYDRCAIIAAIRAALDPESLSGKSSPKTA